MKRVITASTYRNYEVSIMLKYLRIRSSADFIQNWVLEGPNVEYVREFAYDVLSGMTPREIFEDFKDCQQFCEKYNVGEDESIQYNVAKKAFKVYVSRV